MLEYLYIVILVAALVKSKFTKEEIDTDQLVIGTNRFNKRDDRVFMTRYERMMSKWGQNLK